MKSGKGNSARVGDHQVQLLESPSLVFKSHVALGGVGQWWPWAVLGEWLVLMVFRSFSNLNGSIILSYDPVN